MQLTRSTHAQVFWSVALYLGDGGYQIVKMAFISYMHWLLHRGDQTETAMNEKVFHLAPACLLATRVRATSVLLACKLMVLRECSALVLA